MKKQEFKKMKRGLGTSRTTLNVPISESYRSQKGKRKSKKLKNYLKKYFLPQSGKVNRFPGSPGSLESHREVGPKEAHKAHHDYITQDQR